MTVQRAVLIFGLIALVWSGILGLLERIGVTLSDDLGYASFVIWVVAGFTVGRSSNSIGNGALTGMGVAAIDLSLGWALQALARPGGFLDGLVPTWVVVGTLIFGVLVLGSVAAMRIQ